MRPFHRWVFLLWLGVVPALSQAQTLATAGQGLNAVALPAGPKATALGGAYSAWADDTSTVYWNPAGMAFFPKNEIQTAFNQWFQDTFYQDVGGVWPLGGGIVLGGHLAYVNLGSIAARDSSGYTTGITLNPEDWGLAFAAATHLGPLALGLSVKSYLEVLPDVSYGALGLDTGAIFRSGILSLSAGVRNLGLASSYDFPTDAFTGGALAWNVGILDFHLATDADFTTQGNQLHHGIELGYRQTVFLRAGYQWFPNEITGQDLTGFSGGVGLRLTDVELDYSLVSYGDLGATNQVAISYQFENKPKQPESDEDDYDYGSSAASAPKTAAIAPVTANDQGLSVQQLYKKGIAAYKKKDYGQALSYLSAAVSRPVTDGEKAFSAQADIMLGVIYEYHRNDTGHMAQALRFYRESLKLEPDNQTVQKHLSDLNAARAR